MRYHDWHVGMKVTYVGGACRLYARHGVMRLFGKWRSEPSALIPGGVYEIAHIGFGRNRLTGEEEVGVGIKDDPDGCEGLHPARCFRPLQAKKTDISVFTRMLKKQKAKVPA